MSENNLPTGWALAKFEDLLIDPKADLVDGPFGSNLRSSEYIESGVPVLKIQNIKADRFVRKHFSYVSEKKAAELSRHSFVPGDLMITKLGAPLGLCCEVPKDFPAGVFVADLMRLRLRTNKLSKRFVLLAINSQVVQSQFKQITKGTTRPRVNLTIVRSLEIPLPPLAEQKRIVAKIEELFSELEAGEESLRVARRQLGVYRQSLLKQAFEGKLTEKWRAENPRDTVAPNVPAITSDKELGTLDTLPAGWVWTYLSNLGELGRGKSKHRPRNDAKLFGGPYPFIQTGEVKAASKTVTNYTETYSEFGLAQSKLWPKGTLCITIAANIAETAFLGFDACFPDSVVGFVPNRDIANAEFVELFIRSVRSRIEKYAPATAQKNINLTTLESLVVPLCSLPEQQEIVRLLDEQFEAIERNEREIDAALKRSEALRQAILKKAFTGRLVPQSPADEPASELLARLRAERAAQSAKTKSRP